MQTIQEVLRGCDRKAVIDAYIYTFGPSIWKIPNDCDLTAKEVKQNYADNINKLIDMLLETKPAEGEKFVLIAHHIIPDKFWDEDIAFDLISMEDFEKDNPTIWGFFTAPTEEVVSYLVSDAYTTQYHLTDLICYYLYEVSFFGWEREDLEKEMDDLRKQTEEIENGTAKTQPIENLWEEIEDEFDWTPEKRDSEEEKKEREVEEKIWEFNHDTLLHEIKMTLAAMQ